MSFAVRRWLWPKSLFGKAGVVFLVAGLLLILTWLVAIAVTEWRLAEAMKVSEVEFGLPNDVKALLGPPLPPEKNAAVALDQAVDLVHEWLADSIKRVGDVGVAHQFEADAVLRSLVMGTARRAASGSRSEKGIHVAISRFALAQSGGSCVAPPRVLVWVETFASQQLERLGRQEEAVQRMLRSMRISRQWIGREPDVLEAMENVSEQSQLLDRLNELLRRRKFLAAVHDEIDRELAEQAKCRDVLAFQYQCEKLQHLDAFHQHPKRQAFWWMIRPIANNDRQFIVDCYNQLLRTSQRPLCEVRNELETARNMHIAVSKDRWASLLHPEATNLTFWDTHVHYDIHEMHVRCLRIVNAMAKRGHWSLPLESLGLPAECLIDPCDGGRIRVKKKPAGPVIYSIGPDLRDDGGDVTFKRDVGFGPEEPATRFP